MRFSLRPRDDSFFDLFIAAAQKIVAATALLAELAPPHGSAEAVSAQLVELEDAADEITHNLYKKLNSTFITPFDREDIYRLGALLDDVMDHIEAAGSLLPLYGLTDLAALPAEMHDLSRVLDQQAHLTVDAMQRLKSLKGLEAYWIDCNRLENEGDRIYRGLLARLFSGEYDALTVMKLKEVADVLEAACDGFEHIANAVETIAVKES
jgi:predicted phosphate transport protein (TIGR00153 family)